MLLDGRYFPSESLTALIQSAAVVVLPYDSVDQVTSGALVDAVTSAGPSWQPRFRMRSSFYAMERASSSTTTMPTVWQPRCDRADAAAARRFDGRRGAPTRAGDGVARCRRVVSAAGATARRR